MVLIETNGDGMLYYVNTPGRGEFSQVIESEVTTRSTDATDALAVADIDGDGRGDVVVVGHDDIKWLRNNGDGTLVAPADDVLVPAYSAGQPQWNSITLADMNNGTAAPYSNAASIDWPSLVDLAPAAWTDGHPDMILATDNSNEGSSGAAARLYLGASGGQFNELLPRPFAESTMTSTTAVGDLNGDGRVTSGC